MARPLHLIAATPSGPPSLGPAEKTENCHELPRHHLHEQPHSQAPQGRLHPRASLGTIGAERHPDLRCQPGEQFERPSRVQSTTIFVALTPRLARRSSRRRPGSAGRAQAGRETSICMDPPFPCRSSPARRLFSKKRQALRKASAEAFCFLAIWESTGGNHAPAPHRGRKRFSE